MGVDNNTNLDRNLALLNEFNAFEDGWDGSNSRGISAEVVDRVRLLLPKLSIQPNITPTPTGGIHFRYCEPELDIDNPDNIKKALSIFFSPKGTIFLFVYLAEFMFGERANLVLSDEEIVRRVNIFLKTN